MKNQGSRWKGSINGQYGIKGEGLDQGLSSMDDNQRSHGLKKPSRAHNDSNKHTL